MKKYLILLVALLFATFTVSTAQRKVATDKLQVTGLKNAETVGFDEKGNAFAKEFPKVDLSPIQEELAKKLNAGTYTGTAQDLATQLNDALAKVVANEASLTDLTAVLNTTKQQLESLAVADVGGLADEIARLEGLIANAGKIKTVNGVVPDSEGNVNVDLSNFVPYLGATKDLKLGSNFFDSNRGLKVHNAGDNNYYSYYEVGGSTVNNIRQGSYVCSKQQSDKFFLMDDNTSYQKTAELEVDNFKFHRKYKPNNEVRDLNITYNGITKEHNKNGKRYTLSLSFADKGDDEPFTNKHLKLPYKSGTLATLNDVQETIKSAELLGLKPSTAPNTPQKGTIYFDSTANKLKCYDGTEWHDLW